MKTAGIGSWNIRVYGIWIREGNLLVTEERIGDRWIQKFPGGGLQWGEGTLDALAREWREELDMDPGTAKHFYTTDFFQPSAFDGSQVISIYYLVTPDWDPSRSIHEIRHLEPACRVYWIPLMEMDPQSFGLPIDRKVAEEIAKHPEIWA